MAYAQSKNFTVVEIGSKSIKMLAGSFSGSAPYVYCLKEIPNPGQMNNGLVVYNSANKVAASVKEILNVQDEVIATKCSMQSVWVVLPPNGMMVYSEQQISAVTGRSNGKGQIDSDDIRQLLSTIAAANRTKASNYSSVEIVPGLYRYGSKTSTTAPYGEVAKEIEATAKVHCVPQDLKSNQSGVFEMSGVAIHGFEVSPYAASKMISLEKKDLDTYLILDLGASNTSVSLIGKGDLYQSRSLLEGADNLTEKIAETMNVSLEEAEYLKVTYGYSLRKTRFKAPLITDREGKAYYQEDLNKIIASFFEDFDVKLNSTLETLLKQTMKENSQSAESIIASCPIILIGGGANLLGIEDLLKGAIGEHKVEKYVPFVAGARDSKYVSLLGLIIAKATSDNPLTNNERTPALSRVEA